jgi:hypothetical protein
MLWISASELVSGAASDRATAAGLLSAGTEAPVREGCRSLMERSHLPALSQSMVRRVAVPIFY